MSKVKFTWNIGILYLSPLFLPDIWRILSYECIWEYSEEVIVKFPLNVSSPHPLTALQTHKGSIRDLPSPGNCFRTISQDFDEPPVFNGMFFLFSNILFLLFYIWTNLTENITVSLTVISKCKHYFGNIANFKTLWDNFAIGTYFDLSNFVHRKNLQY